AADYCPKRSEGFTFAALMSITNLASALADNVGALLYQHVFSSRLSPLILVSAAFTAFAWILIPLLRLGHKPQGRALPYRSAFSGARPTTNNYTLPTRPLTPAHQVL